MKVIHFSTACLSVMCMVGCSQQTQAPRTPSQPSIVADADKYLLGEEPLGALDVIQVRESSEDGDDIVIVGRIGGSENPWIADRAAFSIVDRSLKACNDNPGDQCKTPWDYCCETEKLASQSAFVKVVNDAGNVVNADARMLLDVRELSTVVVSGKAQRDTSGNLTVLASGVYVRNK